MYTTTFLQCHKTTITAVGAITTILTDQWGNRLSIDDPDAGTHTYDNNGQLQTLTYSDGFSIKYNYLSNGKLYEIRKNDSGSKLFYRVISRNKYNHPTSCEYGNGVATKYEYNPYGLLTRIQTGKKSGYSIDDEEPETYKSIPIEEAQAYIVDSTILNYRYAYDTKGLMSSRSESVMNRLEKYTYDDLDRLETVTAGTIGQTGTTQAFTYYDNGNIKNNSKVGIYKYGTHLAPSTSPQLHAVTEIEPISESVISVNQCDVNYNFFNQPTQITEGKYKLNLFYGANQQRNKAIKYEYKNNNYVVENTRIYVNKRYEKEIDAANITRHYHYIYGDNGVVALHIKKQSAAGTTDSMYYVHTDHLGSYCAITNPSKQAVQRNYFDPWGNMPKIFFGHYQRGDTLIVVEAYLEGDSISISEMPNINFSLTARGFTGHEHYPYFKIINMNGRLYDPVIARFFSPDKYVANSSFTQDYNRYTYARNNPLMYKDPSGEFIITFLVNAIIGWVHGENGWKKGGNAIGNYFKILGGLFTTDKNRTGGGQIWEMISRFTWQGAQTGVGNLYALIANLCGQIDDVSYKAGATVMSGNFWGTGEAVTIGSYIHGNSHLEASFDNPTFQHEYGHYLQSQATGFMYFQRYALPSAFSGGKFKDHHKYHPVEQDANARALKYFSKKVSGFNVADEEGVYNNGEWHLGSNPIIGYNKSLSIDDPMNQKALKYARLQPQAADWILGPNIIFSSWLLNIPMLNDYSNFRDKLDLMKYDGFDIEDWLYKF